MALSNILKSLFSQPTPIGVKTLRPLLGLDYSLPSTALPDESSLVASNFHFDKGLLTSRDGYGAIGTADSYAVTGVTEFRKVDGTRIPIRLTGGGTNVGNLWQWTSGAWAKVEFTGNNTDTLDGTATDQFSMAVAEGNNFVFCQGVNNVMYWDGSADFAQLVASTARYLIAFADRVILGYVDGVGTRLKWSTTTITTWTGTGSGTNDFDQTPDPITNLGVLLDTLIVYKESNIWLGQRTGDANNPFYFIRSVNGQGLLLPFCLIDLGIGHLIVGEDDIYIYNGSSDLKPVGGKIRREFYRSLNRDAARAACGTYLNDTKEVVLFIPEGSSSVNTAAWVLNLDSGQWTKYSLGHVVSSVGQSLYTDTAETTTWDQDVGTWNEATDTWAAGAIPKIQERFGTSTGLVMAFSESALNDNGTAITCQWESKDFDFELPFRIKQVLRVLIGYQSTTGISLSVSISVDEGVTWTTQTRTLTSSGAATERKFFDFTVSGQKVRVKIYFSSSTQSVKIGEVSVQYTDSGDYLG